MAGEEREEVLSPWRSKNAKNGVPSISDNYSCEILFANQSAQSMGASVQSCRIKRPDT